MDNSLEDNIKKYLRSIYLKPNRALEIRKVGQNNSGRMRVLLYASAGTDLNDYAIYFQSENQPIQYFFRFPKANSIMPFDGYICVYVGNTNKKAIMNGKPIRTFHMGYENDTIPENSKAYLIRISLTAEVGI